MSCLQFIYFAHIHSHLNYCSNIFSLLSIKDLIRVQTLQKKAVRLVCKKSYNSHTAPFFIQTAIIPFQDLIQVNALCFMYEYRLNRLPSSFNNSWILNRDTDPHYMLRNGKDFAIPGLKYQYLKSHPLLYFLNLWN